MKSALLLLFVGISSMFGQFNQLQKLSAASSGHYSEAEAQAAAVELIRPLTPDRSAVATLAGWLARKQLDWQDGRIRALVPAKLLAGVNRELGLESSPDLQLRDDELQQMRAFLRSRVPGLIGADAAAMSPFDAFLSMEWLVRLKISGAPIPSPLPASTGRPVSARLVASTRPYNPADHPFMAKVMHSWYKWPTAAAGLRTLERVLAESQ